MPRDPRYDILFEPVQIGPKQAKNRFYQPGHCNGMGRLRPRSHARMRGIKAEGGWAVINTEHCGIHPSAEMFPEPVMTLWDERDVPIIAAAADEVHAHGGLFGIQLSYSGGYHANRFSREVPMGPMARPVFENDPLQARAIDKQDIRQIQSWWSAAVRRAMSAGVDIINVSGQFSSIAFHLMSPRNRRTDEYGGSLENRVRYLRELIDITRETAKGECAVTVRIIVEEFLGTKGIQAHGDGREIIECLGELPDLWDVVCGTWEGDSPSSRFAPENVHEPYIEFVKSVTTKPVVGVGRFTSPDTMASLIKRGVLDMIGATRPSIADPFIPKKIEQGRVEDIRECIGCNICVSGQFLSVNYRCTQNPTAGEEWRRGWHPEEIAAKGSDDTVLVVGSGPAGLEAARALGERGYQVTLAEAKTELGGRVTRESRLPGLAEWARVRDWRVTQLNKLSNVEIYLDSELSADHVRDFGYQHVVLATGARWRADGVGRIHNDPIPGVDSANVFSPDDVMDGQIPKGPVVIFDDDHYYMGNMIAEVLRKTGCEVTIVTPAANIASWTENTLELERVAEHMHAMGVNMITHHNLINISSDAVTISHIYTRVAQTLAVNAVVLVTARLPVDALYHELLGTLDGCSVKTISRIGDCLAPAAIVHATFAGHRYARELDTSDAQRQFLHEFPGV